MLRGDGNWKTLGLHASDRGRILSTVDALLNCVPFWFRVRLCRGSPVKQAHCALLPACTRLGCIAAGALLPTVLVGYWSMRRYACIGSGCRRGTPRCSGVQISKEQICSLALLVHTYVRFRYKRWAPSQSGCTGLPPWALQGTEWMDRHVQLLEDVAKPDHRVGTMPDALRLVEAALVQAAVMAPDWAPARRGPWLASLAAAAAADTRSMLLHTVSLQASRAPRLFCPTPAF